MTTDETALLPLRKLDQF